MAKQQDITVVKGDTARWSSFIYDETTGSTYDFTNCNIYMQIRNGFYPATLVNSYSTSIFSSPGTTYPSGLTGGISAATGGTLYMSIGSTYTEQLSLYRVCKYDVRVEDLKTEDYKTVLQGNIFVLPEITDT